MKNVIILGAKGFIGKYLLTNFLSDQKYVTKGFSSVECNLLSLGSINEVLFVNKGDTIIMCSGITRQVEDSFESMKKNLQMVENLTRFLTGKKIQQIIFLSTVEVYGQDSYNFPITENTSTNPANYYALSKLSSEFLLQKFCRDKKIAITILRLPGIFGEGDAGKSTINNLVTSAIRGKVVLQGNDSRDYVHVNDLFEIIKMCIIQKTNKTLNIASGESLQIRDIVKIIQEILDSPFQVDSYFKIKQDLIFDISILNNEFPDLKFTGFKNRLQQYIKSTIS